MRISDWSSDVCSSDLHRGEDQFQILKREIGRHLTPCQFRLAPGWRSIRRCDGKIVQRTEVADHIPIGPFGRDAGLDLPIIEACAFLEVHSDHLTWAQAALTDHGAFGNDEHPGTRTHKHYIVGGTWIAKRPESIKT